jgi:hypothetical protein
MTHEQAIARCAQLNRDEDGERRWFVRQAGDEDWEIVSVVAPGLHRLGPLKEGVESKPRPSEPPDPRPTIIRNIPPYGAG